MRALCRGPRAAALQDLKQFHVGLGPHLSGAEGHSRSEPHPTEVLLLFNRLVESASV